MGQHGNYYTESFKKCKDKYYDKSLKKTIVYNADLKPMFPGGPSAYMRYLNKTFKFPEQKGNIEDVQTSTMVDFIVDVDGQILNPKIVKQLSNDGLTEFESEFLRVIRNMPKWIPGKCHNKVIPVIIRLPIIVEIELDDEE